MSMEKSLWQHITTVRQQSPLVHNITNFVVMNNTANALLAVGASPIMAHARSEVADMVAIAHALVINIGTLAEYWVDSMLLAAETANKSNKPWVLDPVGAGATAYRDEVLQKLLAFNPTIIRGNASEIIALAKNNTAITKGVDSTAASNDAIASARLLVEKYNAVVCISGAVDFVVDSRQIVSITNGHPLMTKVTGLGCSATAIIGAFAGVTANKTEAAVAAMAILSIAGELAEQQSKGPGSLQLHLLDQLYTLTEEVFNARLKLGITA